MNNWIEVSGKKLAANFRAIQVAAGSRTTVLAVIKANGYGHGAELCAETLVRAGAEWLGVTSAGEGARVRATLDAAGLQAEILIMCGFLRDDAALIQEHALTPVLWTAEQIGWLPAYSDLRVHVEVDTGMGRQGVSPGAPLDELLQQIAAAGLLADGIFTHFCSAEVAHSALTARQQQKFTGVIEQVRAAGVTPRWVHAGNSSAVDNPAPDNRWIADLAETVGARALVRTGLALYGYALPIEGCGEAGFEPSLQPSLQPVLAWKASVLAVRWLAEGETIGYNATFTAPEAMRVALLPVGYADGLRRELSSTGEHGGGWVMLHGQRAPILGRISMNLTVVEVTHLHAVQPGSEATILGEGIDADDHANLAETIAYEILCGIHPCG